MFLWALFYWLETETQLEKWQKKNVACMIKVLVIPQSNKEDPNLPLTDPFIKVSYHDRMVI